MEKLGSGLKKVLLAGIGAVAVTGEKSKELLDEMVKKGELTVEQGKALNEELKHNIKSTVKEKVNVKVKTSSPEELDELLDKMTPEQMALLKQRIDEMEKKQEEFEAAETVEDVADESVCEGRYLKRNRFMSKGESKEYRTRLKEITSVLHKYGITRGITPQKLRMILEDLGPTYIKIGQIMSLHSDILPKRYCDELMCLRSEVTPMEFPEVKEVIEQAYGCPWNEIFAFISDTPLGSASIAQVHRAELLSGEQVVIKVQRTGIYEIMARDIGLLRKAVKLMPPISLKGMADFDQVLDELWNVTREEMNFLTEASNMEEFARRNADVVYVRTPKLYQEYTTMHVLVMEYIEGPAIDDKEKLLAGGYDLEEIGIKLIDNYIKQVMEDGFFHADPHPGNVKIQDGKIVWIDMGMMGRLTERDKELIGKAIRGIAENDIGMIQEAVMALGEFKGETGSERIV